MPFISLITSSCYDPTTAVSLIDRINKPQMGLQQIDIEKYIEITSKY
jgi:hypothetical protein